MMKELNEIKVIEANDEAVEATRHDECIVEFFLMPRLAGVTT